MCAQVFTALSYQPLYQPSISFQKSPKHNPLRYCSLLSSSGSSARKQCFVTFYQIIAAANKMNPPPERGGMDPEGESEAGT